MKPETKVKLLVYCAAIAFVCIVFARIAYGGAHKVSGAPIPVDPHYIILTDKVAVHNSKPVMIWWHKQYRNDRVFANNF